MDVSVIFATYNREDVLDRVFAAWRQVDLKTKYEYEIICSDDASSDNTVEIIKSASDLPIKLLQNEKGGAAKARNAALKIAKGKIVIFTGDDMFPEPDFVNQHFENYLKFGEKIATLGRIEWHPELDMNYLMYHITNIGCEQFGFIGLPAYQLIDYRHFYTSNISVPMSQLQALDQFFSTEFDKYGFEDIEFGYRLEKNGMKIYYDPDIVITHHHIYDSVEKFFKRHTTAGEELVVFHQIHPELEDNCIYDIEDLKRVFSLFSKNHSASLSPKGCLILVSLQLAMLTTKVIEKIIKNKKHHMLKSIESILYAGIFKFAFLYGCSTRIAQEYNMPKSRIAQFTWMHMKKNFTQLYWDTGYGMNENESRKWVCWDNSELVLRKELPKGIKALRFSPIKTRCKATLKELIIEKANGEVITPPIAWHNAQETNWVEFNFQNTNDPQIILEKLPEDYKAIEIRVSVEAMEKKSLYHRLRRGASKIKQRIKTNKINHQDWSVEYVSGQPRRVQICVSGLTNQARKNLIQQYKDIVEILGDSVTISDSSKPERGYVTYHYSPQMEPLEITQMLQVSYLLLNSAYDYVIVSKSFTDFPFVGCKCLDDILIYSELLNKSTPQWIQYAKGRLIRLPAYNVEQTTINLYSIYNNLELQKEYFLSTSRDVKPVFRQSIRNFNFNKSKPVIFVVPIFLAVGGVERNTIEVMRALKNDYTFCMITMERHSQSQGSLHYQLKGICSYIFDLREITEFENYLNVLYELKQIFKPDILWLCNNSPWFEMNTLQIRNMFYDVAIVSQDVYDTKVGWIEYYKNPEVKMFDRYIAVTELIKQTFIEEYGIPEQKIDVIYSVIDGSKIKKELKEQKDQHTIYKKYGLVHGKKYFGFVGRLTEQKNPIRFLKLAEMNQNAGVKDIGFIMVGDGLLNKEVDSFIEQRNITNVMRIPFVENTPEFINILDGLILTSVYEGMPIVSIEAMCMSTPIFSTDAGDLKRFLDKTNSGLIINESKSDYENFNYFLESLNLYKINSQKHAAEMLNFFSAYQQAETYRKTFNQAITENKRKE